MKKNNNNKNPEFYIFALISTICGKCDNNNKKIFKEKESIKLLTTLGLANNQNKIRYLRCKKYAENKNSNVSHTAIGKVM